MTTLKRASRPDDSPAQVNSAQKTQGQAAESADQRLIAWRRAVTAHRLERVVLPSFRAADSRTEGTVTSA